MLVAVWERQKACDRAVLVSCPVHPARHRQDRDIALDAISVLARAERGRGKFRIIRQGLVVITEFGDEGRHPKVRNMLAYRRVPCVAAWILVDRRRTC